MQPVPNCHIWQQSEWWAGAIKMYLLLKKINAPENVQVLLSTIVRISQILYADDSKRTPRRVLSLYNQAWLHMELCRELIAPPKNISRNRMFGSYLHALTVHAPIQYEAICQKSINAENQERLFGQARKAAEAASNRHKGNVVSTIMLRLQAKKEVGHILQSVELANSQVSRAASNLPTAGNTEFNKNFLKKRTNSWQAHLERISPFLEQGKGKWWIEDEERYTFLDGDSKTESPQLPQLLDFRHATLQDVREWQKASWEHCLNENIQLPTTTVVLYDENGMRQQTESVSEPEDTTTFPTIPTQAMLVLPDGMESDEDTTEELLEEVTFTITEEDPKVTERDTPHIFHTSTAMNISKFLNQSQLDILYSYDNARSKLKAVSHSVSKAERNKYQAVSCQLKSIVTTKRAEIRERIKELQTDFYTNHGRTPSVQENEELRNLVKLRDIASKLLLSWDKI